MKDLSTPLEKFMANSKKLIKNPNSRFSYLTKKNTELLNHVKLQLDIDKQNTTKKSKLPRKGYILN